MRFRKKPVEIEAVKWLGVNTNEVQGFCGRAKVQGRKLRIPTMEGHIWAKEGDWIIKGVNGEFYPCDDEVFWKTYEYLVPGDD